MPMGGFKPVVHFIVRGYMVKDLPLKTYLKNLFIATVASFQVLFQTLLLPEFRQESYFKCRVQCANIIKVKTRMHAKQRQTGNNYAMVRKI